MGHARFFSTGLAKMSPCAADCVEAIRGWRSGFTCLRCPAPRNIATSNDSCREPSHHLFARQAKVAEDLRVILLPIPVFNVH